MYSIFNILCQDESKVYFFDVPYQAGLKYYGVMKKEGEFYIQDEDGDFRDIFFSEGFVQFIDDSYWKLYADEE